MLFVFCGEKDASKTGYIPKKSSFNHYKSRNNTPEEGMVLMNNEVTAIKVANSKF